MGRPEDIDAEKGVKEPFLNHPSKTLGGFRTLPFILANEAFERAAFYGLQPNMVLYLMGAYGLDMASASNINFMWDCATSFTPILAALLADSYVGRYRMIGFGSVLSFLGAVSLWSTTIVPGVRPSHEETTLKSSSPILFKLVYLCLSLALMSIGAGGIRSSVLSFGADQLSNIKDGENSKPGSSRAFESFFSWYYSCIIVATLFALTCLVYIQDHYGMLVGFAIPVLVMLVSVVCFFSASSFYVKMEPKSSVLSGLAQVVVASWRNRHYQLSSENIYHVAKGSVMEVPTEKLRCLNKACIIKNRQQDLNADGIALDPWRLCTTDQVEEFKAIINIIPLWSTGIMLGVNIEAVLTFLVVQAKSMDRHFITPNFEIPSASFLTFALISILVWLILYNNIIIPLASKVMGSPVRIDPIIRTGIGLFLSFICTAVAGFVESSRRGTALAAREGNLIKPMSSLWLVPQVCLIGLAEGITAIAQIELYYSEFPRSMSSISSNFFGLCLSVSALVASFIVSVVNYFTKQDGKEGWVSSDLDKGHFDYFYWLLAGLSLVNCFYFVVCSTSFREKKKASQEKMNLIN